MKRKTRIGLVTSGLMVPELGPKGKIQQEFALKNQQAAAGRPAD